MPKSWKIRDNFLLKPGHSTTPLPQNDATVRLPNIKTNPATEWRFKQTMFWIYPSLEGATLRGQLCMDYHATPPPHLNLHKSRHVMEQQVKLFDNFKGGRILSKNTLWHPSTRIDLDVLSSWRDDRAAVASMLRSDGLAFCSSCKKAIRPGPLFARRPSCVTRSRCARCACVVVEIRTLENRTREYDFRLTSVIFSPFWPNFYRKSAVVVLDIYVLASVFVKLEVFLTPSSRISFF